jgi:hypothetical protein
VSMAGSISGLLEPEPRLVHAKLLFANRTVPLPLGQAMGKQGQAETDEFRSLRRCWGGAPSRVVH